MACGDVIRLESVVVGQATHPRGRNAYDLAYEAAKALVDQTIQSLLDAYRCPSDCSPAKRVIAKGFTVDRVNAHWRWRQNDISLEVHLKVWVEFVCPPVPVVTGGGGGGVIGGGGGSSGGGTTGGSGGSQPVEEEEPPPPPPCNAGCTCQGKRCPMPGPHQCCPFKDHEGEFVDESRFGCHDYLGRCDLEQGHDGMHHCNHGHYF